MLDFRIIMFILLGVFAFALVSTFHAASGKDQTRLVKQSFIEPYTPLVTPDMTVKLLPPSQNGYCQCLKSRLSRRDSQ